MSVFYYFCFTYKQKNWDKIFGLIVVLFSYSFVGSAAAAPQNTDPFPEESYSFSEISKAGHVFFNRLSGGLANALEHAFSTFGTPTAYIVGEEAAGSFIAGVSYGEGKLHFRNKGEYQVFWQGPSFGFDAGIQGMRVMMLVYNLEDIDHFWARYGGFSGNAYLVAGFSLTALYHKKILIVPIRTGMGARLGINFNYLKFTSAPTWNPF